MGASESAYDKDAASSGGGGSEASSETSPASGGEVLGQALQVAEVLRQALRKS